MSIESLDHAAAVSYLGTDDNEESWQRFDEYHRAALERLEASGADFALMASNTPHHRFDSIVRGVGIPVINIFEAAAKESARLGAHEILILGTAVTMASPVLCAAFAKHGVTAAGLSNKAAGAMAASLIAELQEGKVRGGAERVARIVKLALGRKAQTRPAVCLACTELPLAFGARKMAPSFESDGCGISIAQPCISRRRSNSRAATGSHLPAASRSARSGGSPARRILSCALATS